MMTRKIKLLLTISVAFVVILSAAMVVCYAEGVFDENTVDKQYFNEASIITYEPVRNGGIDDALVEQIKVGMSLTETIEILGQPQRDIGSGVLILEWQLKSGDRLAVCFNSKTDSAQTCWYSFKIKIEPNDTDS